MNYCEFCDILAKFHSNANREWIMKKQARIELLSLKKLNGTLTLSEWWELEGHAIFSV